MFNNQNKEDQVDGGYKGLKGQQIGCPHPHEASQESEDFGSHLKETIPVKPRALLLEAGKMLEAGPSLLYILQGGGLSKGEMSPLPPRKAT